MLSNSKIPQISTCLERSGLEILGEFTGPTGVGIMIANCGPAMWQHFTRSCEFEDGKPDPLNRWSARILDAIANKAGAKLVLPFEKPFAPFQQWAMLAAGLTQSPLGLLIHPEYGLWFGLRGVLFFPAHEEPSNPRVQPTEDICVTCIDKPCLNACPVDAFGIEGLNVSTCFSHLDTNGQPDCMGQGCAARGACPVGVEYTYSEDQLRFHLAAYRG